MSAPRPTDDNVIIFPQENPAQIVEDEDDSDEVHAVGRTIDGHVVIEADQDTIDVPYAVDPPAHRLTWHEIAGTWSLGDRPSVLPPWATSWTAFKRVVWHLSRLVGYLVTFHGVRLPKYGLRFLLASLAGFGEVVAMFVGWLLDREGRGMSRLAHDTADQAGWKSTRKEWHETVRGRIRFALLVLVAMTAALTVSYWAVPAWTVAVAAVLAAVGVGVCAWIGIPEGERLADVPMERGMKVIRITSGMILRALDGCGVPAISKALKEDPKSGVKFTEQPKRDQVGRGYEAQLSLPGGSTATDVIERRERLAAGLRKPMGCVWPEGVKGGHPGLLSLYVADDDMNAATQARCPWAAGRKSLDLFERQAFGTNARGQIVTTRLIFASGVIGAVPRVGKTVALRCLLLIAALDVRSRVYAFDKKGSGDLSPLAHVAHAYTVGDDDEEIDKDLAYLRGLQAEMRRRYKIMRGLPKAVCPESKVTPEMCSDRSLGMEPIVVGVDEVQVWFQHSTKKIAEEFVAIATDLVKRGPSAGIMFFCATQKPDAGSIPTQIRDNAVWRFCLKVMDAAANNQTLGSGQYANGANATMLTFDDLGVGYLVADGERWQIVKTFDINTEKADKIGLRARELRVAAGRLTGYATGQEDAPTTSQSLVEDLPKVFASHERLHSETVLERLIATRPGFYDGWSTSTFAGALRDQLGIATRQVKIQGQNRQGLLRDDVLEAAGAALDPAAGPT